MPLKEGVDMGFSEQKVIGDKSQITRIVMSQKECEWQLHYNDLKR